MKLRFSALLVLLLLAALALPAAAQTSTPEFRLDLNRDFGYGAGANVRGNFSARLHGELDTVAEVVYYIDGEELGRSAENPFRVKFITSTYSDGWHDLWAVVTTVDGRSVETERMRMNFVSAEYQSQSLGRIFGILLPLLLIITAVGALLQGRAMRGDNALPPGTPRSYGWMGGAICPRCQRPFPIHMWSLSMMVGRLDRCDNCGKWSLVRRAPPEILAAAERAEAAAARRSEGSIPAAAPESAEDALKRRLDESRYSDPDN